MNRDKTDKTYNLDIVCTYQYKSLGRDRLFCVDAGQRSQMDASNESAIVRKEKVCSAGGVPVESCTLHSAEGCSYISDGTEEKKIRQKPGEQAARMRECEQGSGREAALVKSLVNIRAVKKRKSPISCDN